MTRTLHALALAALVAAPGTVLAQRAAPTTVILVRHAEKVMTDPRDPNPVLTPAGERRARDLAHLLRHRHIAAVITTQYARTRLTGQPTADAAHLALDTVHAGRDAQAHAAAVAELIRTRYAGKTVLVVGHTNTVPKIIAALGGPALGDLCDSAYSNLFTLVIPARGAPRLSHGHYGHRDPPGGRECTDGIRQEHHAAGRR